MPESIGGATKLDHVLSSVNNVPVMSEKDWLNGTERPPLWENDKTPLNEENMNRLSNGILLSQRAMESSSYQIKEALKAIIENSSGWKSVYKIPGELPTAEIFNDYKNNSAVSSYSHSEGLNTHTGMRGYFVGIIDQRPDAKTIWLSNGGVTTIIPPNSDDTPDTITGPDCGFSVDSIAENNRFFCVVSTSKSSYLFTGEITGVIKNKITYNSDMILPQPTESVTAKIFMYRFLSPDNYNVEVGIGAHAEGMYSHAIGDCSHAECRSAAVGDASHSEGYLTSAEGNYSHTEGIGTIASSTSQHVQGSYNEVDFNGDYAHIIGGGTSETDRKNIHTVDWSGNAWYSGDVRSNEDVIARSKSTDSDSPPVSLCNLSTDLATEVAARKAGDLSIIGENNGKHNSISLWGVRAYAKKVGEDLVSQYIQSTTESEIKTLQDVIDWVTGNRANGFRHILNEELINKQNASDSVGKKDTVAGNGTGEIFNDYSENNASGEYSHAEGFRTSSGGDYSHAEGYYSQTLSQSAHSEGKYTTAGSNGSHAEGGATSAYGRYSHTEGVDTIAFSDYQHVQGVANIVDRDNKYAHIIGGGAPSSSEPSDYTNANQGTRKNIHTVDWHGNAWYAGNMYLGKDEYGNYGGIYLNCSEQCDSMGYRVPIIYTGTTKPDNSIGQEGDIYIMYTPVVTNQVSEV